MENASKALIIAGAVLIGILIISMGVLLSTTLQKTAKTYYTSMTTNEIQKFNSDITKNFIIENGNTYITAQGIITLKNILNTEKYKDAITVEPILKTKITDESKFLSKYGYETEDNKIKKYTVTTTYSDQGTICRISIDIDM